MRLLGLVAIIALLCCVGSAHADKPGPSSSYKKITDDGKHVFAMNKCVIQLYSLDRRAFSTGIRQAQL